MTVIKINAITVPEDAGDELARRFAARAGAVDDQDGFEGFELLRPTDERRQWLVVTRWRDEDAFVAWAHVTRLARTATPVPTARRLTVARCRCPRSSGPTRWRAVRRNRRAPERDLTGQGSEKSPECHRKVG